VYLNGNPNPDPKEAAKTFIFGFIQGAVCDWFNAAC
jgi:hypothetical protein